jgi:predicted ester cyclase
MCEIRQRNEEIVRAMHSAATLEEGFQDVSDNVSVEDWTLGNAKVIHGKNELLEKIIRPSDRAFHNETFSINFLVSDPDSGVIVLDGIFSADFVADYKRIKAHGRRVSWPIRDMFRLEHEKIVYMWYASDTLAMLKSLNALDFSFAD